jgi:hypothetical protein
MTALARHRNNRSIAKDHLRAVGGLGRAACRHARDPGRYGIGHEPAPVGGGSGKPRGQAAGKERIPAPKAHRRLLFHQEFVFMTIYPSAQGSAAISDFPIVAGTEGGDSSGR